MGGLGSGSWKKPNSKSKVESKYRLDIRRLKKMGYIQPGKIGVLAWSRNRKQTASISFGIEADGMVLNYWRRPHGGEWEDVNQVVLFDHTPCNFGGYRTWFLCPSCLRRVAVLYGAGKSFWCSHCHNLTYSTQKINRMGRLARKASKIRKKMGTDGNLLDPFPDRPKNMHRKTYWRLRKESERARELWFLMAGQQMCSISNRLNSVRERLGLQS